MAKPAPRNKTQDKNESTDRYRVVTPDLQPIYLPTSEGLRLEQAVRMAQGLRAKAGVALVEEDGSLTLGRVDLSDPVNPVFIHPNSPAKEAEEAE